MNDEQDRAYQTQQSQVLPDQSPSDAVRELYQNHPYPSPHAGSGLIFDVANAMSILSPRDSLVGRVVLDAGCGTGHRLVALAKEFPQAKFVGIDMTDAALAVAAQLVTLHKVDNVILKQGDLMKPLSDSYDVIVSTGVLHHLDSPETGVQNLYHALSKNGFMMIWMYHSYGENSRLLSRRLARLILKHGKNLTNIQGVELLARLGFTLSAAHYGSGTSHLSGEDLSRSSVDVDAFLHPIVNAYTFDEVFSMLAMCDVDWFAPNGITVANSGKLIDLARAHSDPFFTVSAADIFKDELIAVLYESLEKIDKLRATELALRPTGLSVLAGKGNSYRELEFRVEGNLLRGLPRG